MLTVPNVYAGGPRLEWDQRYEDVPGVGQMDMMQALLRNMIERGLIDVKMRRMMNIMHLGNTGVLTQAEDAYCRSG